MKMSMLNWLLLPLLALAFTGCAKPNPMRDDIMAHEEVVEIHLQGATDAATAMAFGRIVSTVPGVLGAKRYSETIVADNPAASSSFWRVVLAKGVDPLTLQADILDTTRQLLRAGGLLVVGGRQLDLPQDEISALLGLRLGEGTSRRLDFVIDRELRRDREMSGW